MKGIILQQIGYFDSSYPPISIQSLEAFGFVKRSIYKEKIIQG